MSEIDDIFASKAKTKAPVRHPLSSSRKKKKKRSSTAVKTQASESSQKRQLPDTIVDTSHHLPTPAKRRKEEKSRHGNPEKNSKEIEAFKDSKGNTGRKRTEEGWVVYKEDELGINDQGGDTELCPFDCNCCF